MRSIAKAFVWLAAGFFLVGVLPPLVFVGAECFSLGAQAPPRAAGIQQAAAGIPGYYRGEAATYLTLPEWYIVYSAEEYAGFIGTRPPSRFPYFRAIRQYWRYYDSACRVTKNAYPFDPGAHLLLGAIGVGFTAKNVVGGVYEGTLGRLGEWLAGHHTEEDAFETQTARAYGTFVRTMPWYEFPFRMRLVRLWRETPLWGPNPARKWERRLALSGEYGAKAACAWLIRRAAGAANAPEDRVIHLWIEGAGDDAFTDPRIVRVKAAGPRAWIVRVPRREAFTEIVVELAHRGARFRDIAGNDEILATALVPRDWRYTLGQGRLLFSERILTDRRLKRVAVYAPVTSLHQILAGLEATGARIENLYDY